MLLFFHGGEIDHIVGDLVVDDFAVWRFDEAVLVDTAERGERVDQANVRAFRRFNRTDAAIMGRVNVADFKAGAFAGQATGAQRRHAALMGDFRKRVGLIHELRQLRGAEKFADGCNSRLRVDQVVRHHGRYIDAAHAFLDGALHTQEADAILVFQQFANGTDPAVAEVVDIIDFALAVLEVDEGLDHRENIFLAQDGIIRRRIEFETHVELHAANGAEVIAFRIEEQAFEQGFRGFARWRFAGTHDTVDIGQGAVTVFGLVGFQRVADPGTGCDMVDVQQFERVDAGIINLFKIFRRHFVTGFDINLAGFLVDQVEGAVAAKNFLGRDDDVLHAIAFRLFGGTRRDLGARFEDDFAALGVDNIKGRLQTAPLLGDERDRPAVLGALVNDTTVEQVEDIFFRIALLDDLDELGALGAALVFDLALDIDGTHGLTDGDQIAIDLKNFGWLLHAGHADHFADLEVRLLFLDLENGVAERTQQCCHRQLALAVDTDVDDVLGVKFKVEPAAAVRNDAGGEQELAGAVSLAAVMVKQDTGRTVHLADDNALGAIDDERAVLGHQGHVAHVNILFLDIENGAGFGFGIDLEHDQAQGYLHRRGIGYAPLAAFLDIIFGIFELVVDEVHFGSAGKIADRENAAQRLFEARDISDRRVRTQKLFI